MDVVIVWIFQNGILIFHWMLHSFYISFVSWDIVSKPSYPPGFWIGLSRAHQFVWCFGFEKKKSPFPSFAHLSCSLLQLMSHFVPPISPCHRSFMAESMWAAPCGCRTPCASQVEDIHLDIRLCQPSHHPPAAWGPCHQPEDFERHRAGQRGKQRLRSWRQTPYNSLTCITNKDSYTPLHTESVRQQTRVSVADGLGAGL